MRRFLLISMRIALGFASASASVPVAFADESESLRHPAKLHIPAAELAQTRSFTASGVPGDPLNIAFCGTAADLLTLMANAGWDPADAITWRSALHIAIASLRRRSYPDAPVSSLYVNGRKQDFAFEQELGDARRRHHVRFWKLGQYDVHGRPLWIGATTHDIGIGVSHANGHPTHHIDPDIDAERDKLVRDVEATGEVTIEWIDNFQPESKGRNAAGDRFVTDRRLAVVSVR